MFSVQHTYERLLISHMILMHKFFLVISRTKIRTATIDFFFPNLIKEKQNQNPQYMVVVRGTYVVVFFYSPKKKKKIKKEKDSPHPISVALSV